MQIKILDRSTYFLSLFGLLLLFCPICLWSTFYEYEYNFAKFDGTSVKNLKDVTSGEPKLFMGFDGNGNDNVVTRQGIMVSRIFSFVVSQKFLWFFTDKNFKNFWCILKDFYALFDNLKIFS